MGGPIETVVAHIGGRAPIIDSRRLYWGDSPNIFGQPLDGGIPELVANLAMNPMGWAVSGDRLYFIHDDYNHGAGPPTKRLLGASSKGGEPSVLVDHLDETGSVAADETGFYWHDTRHDTDGGIEGTPSIRKYTLANGQVVDFAPTGFPRFIRTNGSYVAWDAAGLSDAPTIVWSNTADGSRPMALGRAGLIWQLAIDATSAYWVGSNFSSSDMDVVTAPLAGGSARKIACHLADVYALAVDETHVYYSTWLENGTIGRIPRRAQ